MSLGELAEQTRQVATAPVVPTDELLRCLLAYAFGLAPQVVDGVAAIVAAVGVDRVAVLAPLAHLGASPT